MEVFNQTLEKLQGMLAQLSWMDLVMQLGVVILAAVPLLFSWIDDDEFRLLQAEDRPRVAS